MNTGASAIVLKPHDHKHMDYNEHESIKMIAVDQVVDSNLAIDFALIDVERMEAKAIEGMMGLIRRSSEKLVMMVEWANEKDQGI